MDESLVHSGPLPDNHAEERSGVLFCRLGAFVFIWVPNSQSIELRETADEEDRAYGHLLGHLTAAHGERVGLPLLTFEPESLRNWCQAILEKIASAPIVTEPQWESGRAEATGSGLRFRSGKISLELVREANVVVLEHDSSNGNGLTVDVPEGWAPDLEQFTLWCCRFLGIVLEDKPLFTNVSDPMLADREAEEFVVTLKGPMAEMPKGTVVSLVPEAS